MSLTQSMIRRRSAAHVDTLDGVRELIVRLRARLSRKLESARTPSGIQLRRYLVFATARRP
jgi:hypothetical protein